MVKILIDDTSSVLKSLSTSGICHILLLTFGYRRLYPLTRNVSQQYSYINGHTQSYSIEIADCLLCL